MILSHSQCHQMTKALSLEGLYHSIDLLDHSFKSRPETLFGAKLKSRGGELNSLGQKLEFHIFLIYPNILPQGRSFSDILPQGRFCIFFLHTWRGGH